MNPQDGGTFEKMCIYQAVAAAGLTIPGDLSVISFDNSDIARWLHPALSSMDLPYFDLGRQAVELLLADGAKPRVHRLPMELRSRESVAAPSRWANGRPASATAGPAAAGKGGGERSDNRAATVHPM
jgi:LacI family transcriptional regulator